MSVTWVEMSPAPALTRALACVSVAIPARRAGVLPALLLSFVTGVNTNNEGKLSYQAILTFLAETREFARIPVEAGM
jgi:hypothetical protein